MIKIIYQIVFLLALMGCTHLVSVSTSSVPKKRSSRVKASAERIILFGFNFNNDYVNDMAEELADQCRKGKVQGVLTKHEEVTYFPLVFNKVRVTAEGYCVR